MIQSLEKKKNPKVLNVSETIQFKSKTDFKTIFVYWK